MISVSKVILFDRNHRLLICLRDDKSTIPYPNHWDLLGGIVEPNETPTEGAIREVAEEIGITLESVKEIGQYTSEEKYPFYIFHAEADVTAEELTLTEGQRLAGIDLAERGEYRFVPILQKALDDFEASGNSNGTH